MVSKSICHWPLLQALELNIQLKIKHFAVLDDGNNAIVVTVDDEVYSLGVNGYHAPLGVGDIQRVFKAKKIPELYGKGIVGIVAGNGGHVMALSKNGVVYSWGNNKYNNIDGTMDTVTRPQKLSFSHSVAKIAIGARHTLFLLQNRQVYGRGDNSQGQLGIHTKDCMKGLVKVPLEDVGIVRCIDVVCTENTSYLLVSGGMIYSTGSAENGALGTGSMVDSCCLVKVKVKVPIKQIVGGRNTAYAVSASNAVYSWGSNSKRQLGITSEQFDHQDIPINIGKYSDVAAHFDCDMAAATGYAGKIYVWGETRFGIISNPIQTPLEKLDDAFTVYLESRSYRLPYTNIDDDKEQTDEDNEDYHFVDQEEETKTKTESKEEDESDLDSGGEQDRDSDIDNVSDEEIDAKENSTTSDNSEDKDSSVLIPSQWTDDDDDYKSGDDNESEEDIEKGEHEIVIKKHVTCVVRKSFYLKLGHCKLFCCTMVSILCKLGYRLFQCVFLVIVLFLLLCFILFIYVAIERYIVYSNRLKRCPYL